MAKRTIKPETRVVDDQGEVIITPAVEEEYEPEIIVEAREAPRWKTPYNHDTHAECLRTATRITEPTLTQQHTRDQADINFITRQFGITSPSQMPPQPPSFLHVPANWDMQTAIDLVREGEKAFLAQPPEIRAQFDNDLGLYIDHVDAAIASNNEAELRRLNLAPPKAPENPPPPPGVSSPGPGGNGPPGGPA